MTPGPGRFSGMDSLHGINYFLDPGYIYVSKRPASIRTVVGSCVSVCLWDQSLKFGGMNHFLHPVTRDPATATPRFGNVATTALVRMMEEAGAERANLVAQIFGGGWPQDAAGKNVGDANVLVAREILKRKGVRVLSEDVGGHMGRKVVFDTASGQSVIIKVHRLRSSDWAAS